MGTRATLAVLLAVVGVLSAVALAACRGGESVGGGTLAGQVTITRPTTTRDEVTVTETQSVTTIATTTQTRPSVTVNQPTTVLTVAPTQTAITSEAETSSETSGWVWALVIVFCGAAVGLTVFLIHRHPEQLSPEERRRLLATTVASWTGAGWAIESQTGNSAVLVRGGERMLINVDAGGQVTSGRLATPGPPPDAGQPEQWPPAGPR